MGAFVDDDAMAVLSATDSVPAIDVPEMLRTVRIGDFFLRNAARKCIDPRTCPDELLPWIVQDASFESLPTRSLYRHTTGLIINTSFNPTRAFATFLPFSRPAPSELGKHVIFGEYGHYSGGKRFVLKDLIDELEDDEVDIDLHVHLSALMTEAMPRAVQSDGSFRWKWNDFKADTRVAYALVMAAHGQEMPVSPETVVATMAALHWSEWPSPTAEELMTKLDDFFMAVLSKDTAYVLRESLLAHTPDRLPEGVHTKWTAMVESVSD